ncbi:hypothetical protein D9M68_887150 [compost metagenome]
MPYIINAYINENEVGLLIQHIVLEAQVQVVHFIPPNACTYQFELSRIYLLL